MNNFLGHHHELRIPAIETLQDLTKLLFPEKENRDDSSHHESHIHSSEIHHRTHGKPKRHPHSGPKKGVIDTLGILDDSLQQNSHAAHHADHHQTDIHITTNETVHSHPKHSKPITLQKCVLNADHLREKFRGRSSTIHISIDSDHPEQNNSEIIESLFSNEHEVDLPVVPIVATVKLNEHDSSLFVSDNHEEAIIPRKCTRITPQKGIGNSANFRKPYMEFSVNSEMSVKRMSDISVNPAQILTPQRSCSENPKICLHSSRTDSNSSSILRERYLETFDSPKMEQNCTQLEPATTISDICHATNYNRMPIEHVRDRFLEDTNDS